MQGDALKYNKYDGAPVLLPHVSPHTTVTAEPMYSVQTFDAISDAGLKELPDRLYTVHTAAGAPDAFLLRSHDLHRAALPPSLKAIARSGAGVNNIPLARCSAAGIAVFNTPGANANSVKELVLCGMLLSSRRIVEGIAWARTLHGDAVEAQIEQGKRWFKGPELTGKTLGVIGLGAIGVVVANAGYALGMRTIGFDPFISVSSAWGLSREVHREESLGSLIAKSDYITIHAPLNDKTRDLIAAPQFALMKPGVRLLNFARGPLVKQAALLKALDEGRVACYVTDFPDAVLIRHEKVLPVPHLGASTPEAEDNCAVMAARQLRDYLERGIVVNSVNFPTVRLALPPDAQRIQIVNRNEPSMISQLTAVLGTAGINITDLINKGRGELAYTIIDVHQEVTDAILRRLRAIDGVVRAHRILPQA